MKKILVAISLLLIATLALSVSAFAADKYDFGVEKYYLGDAVKTAPKADGAFGASEYAKTYELKTPVADANLPEAANAKALTSSVKVGLAYDADSIYVAFEAALAAEVAKATYVVTVDGTDYVVDVDAAKDMAKDGYTSVAKLEGGKFVGELVITNNSVKLASGVPTGEVDNEYTLTIKETTKNADGDVTYNVSLWNVVAMSNTAKFELQNSVDYYANEFVLGSEPKDGEVITVEQEATGKPGDTIPAVTEEPKTEEPTTEEPTTEEPTTEPVTEAPTTEPTTEAPTTEPTTEPAPAKKGCGSSVGVMGLALVAALGTCAVVATKKED